MMAISQTATSDQTVGPEFIFLPSLPRDWTGPAPLISVQSTLDQPHEKYLLRSQDGAYTHAYRIRYLGYGLPFHEAKMIGSMLGVGDEDWFYLFDTVTETSLLQLPMLGYFGHLAVFGDIFYVADAWGIHCIAPSGVEVWHNNHLGIDGVLLDRFDGDLIFGDGQWDPPDGWRPFVLDRRTGKVVG